MLPFEPRHILAATDFSELSTWALRHAVVWARRYGADLTVLHVQDWPGADPAADLSEALRCVNTPRVQEPRA